MKNALLALFLLPLISCSSDDSDGNIQQQDPIIGEWVIIESGATFDDGDQFVEVNPCSNAHRLFIFEDGLLDSELRGFNNGACNLDLIRTGEWVKTTSNDFPNANYRLTFNALPDVDDEVLSYAKITFFSSTMRIEYEDVKNESIFDMTYRVYRRE
ncbi:hypothetical protein [Poritiphilus flavus]|uniref:Lipocalin-like domain-containing protein n=1 Tax=Poritiphilus flavus TaxID=2697053 RepID=A0A6L9EDQ0_9FLAO|nr:hypothetical protein [Poritiphilus flavus]NAS12803.1 hypothetical protein [Poritiphilus flavus]